MAHNWLLRTDKGDCVVIGAALKSGAKVWARHFGYITGNVTVADRISTFMAMDAGVPRFESHWDPETSDPLRNAP